MFAGRTCFYRDMLIDRGLWIQPGESGDQVFVKAGLFNPGDVPPPSMETFTKDMESWETVHKSAKGWEVNHGGL